MSMKMKNALRRKLRNQKGFTLAEVLLAVLIMLLTSTIVATGIPAAANVYYKVMDGANAQLLLSTTCTALRRELAFAEEVKLKSGSTKEVESIRNEQGYELEFDGKDETGIKKIYSGYSKSILLVSEAAAAKNLHAEFDDIEYDKEEGIFSIKNLIVVRNGQNESPLIELTDFKVKAVRKPTAA